MTTNDYAALYAEQAIERELFRYPPFCRLIYVYMRGRDEAAVVHAAEAMAQGMRRCFAERVLGPEAPAVARVQSLHISSPVFSSACKARNRQRCLPDSGSDHPHHRCRPV